MGAMKGMQSDAEKLGVDLNKAFFFPQPAPSRA
jgi:hypothetical protein